MFPVCRFCINVPQSCRPLKERVCVCAAGSADVHGGTITCVDIFERIVSEVYRLSAAL